MLKEESNFKGFQILLEESFIIRGITLWRLVSTISTVQVIKREGVIRVGAIIDAHSLGNIPRASFTSMVFQHHLHPSLHDGLSKSLVGLFSNFLFHALNFNNKVIEFLLDIFCRLQVISCQFLGILEPFSTLHVLAPKL